MNVYQKTINRREIYKIMISVIVPVYNVAEYLNKCLDTLVNQTYSNLEIIIVNDGSTDNSYEICKEYADKYENVILIQQENAGLAAARQAGLEVATGEYIGFVDSDDWLELNMYEEFSKVIEESSPDIIFCNVYRDEDKKEKRYLDDGYYNREELERYIFPRLLAGYNENKEETTLRWCNWLRVYKKSLIDENNITFDKRFRRCQDLPFTFETTIRAKSYYYLGSSYLYHNRMNFESLSKGYTKNMWGLIKPLVEYLWNVVNSYEEYDFSKQMKIRTLLFAFDCADNEIKPNNKKKLKEKIKTIREIMASPEMSTWIEDVDTSGFSKINKGYLFCFKHKFATLYYMMARYRFAERFKAYKKLQKEKK